MVNFQSVELFSSMPSRLPSVTAIEGYKGIKLRVAESSPLGLLHADKLVSNRVNLLVTGGRGNPQRLFLYKGDSNLSKNPPESLVLLEF